MASNRSYDVFLLHHGREYELASQFFLEVPQVIGLTGSMRVQIEMSEVINV